MTSRRPSLEVLETRRLLSGNYVATQDSYDFDSIASTGTLLLDNTDDGFARIDLDFDGPGKNDPPNTFRFYGVQYTELFVSVNGLITFGNGSTSSSNGDLTSAPALPTIAVLWDDWDTSIGTGSRVLWEYDDDREELIIQWNNVTHVEVGGNNGVTFQAILDLNATGENDSMEFRYNDLLVGNATYNEAASATVGIKAAGAQGDDRLLVWQDGTSPLSLQVASQRAIEIEEVEPVAPVPQSSSFRYQTAPHELTITFSVPVNGLDPTDLTVEPLAGGPTFNPASASGNGTSTATFTFTGVLPDGRYRATLPAGSVTSTSGLPLAEDYVVQFLFLVGDANNDGTVGLMDFNILAGNFGQSGRDFSQGDFNYDGQVNLQDFNLLANRFGQVLAAPTATTTPPVTNLFAARGQITDADEREEILA